MKEFTYFYTGVDYIGRQYKETYKRVSKWLKIYFNLSGDPYFNFKGKRYRLDNFLRLSSGFASGNICIESEDGEK